MYLISRRFLAELISLTPKIEAKCSSETSVETQRTTRRHIPEDDTLHSLILLDHLEIRKTCEKSVFGINCACSMFPFTAFTPNVFSSEKYSPSYAPDASINACRSQCKVSDIVAKF
jgi:hypothetical protein